MLPSQTKSSVAALEEAASNKHLSNRAFVVKTCDGQKYNVIGPIGERQAYKIHTYLIDAVFSVCVEPAKGEEIRSVA